MSQVRLRILGESLIYVGDTRLEPSATHVFALALYLAIERGKLIPRAVLAALLFPEAKPAQATRNLRQLVYRLRQMGAPLEATAATVRLSAEQVRDAPDSVLSGSFTHLFPSNTASLVLLPGYVPPTAPLSRWLEAYREELSNKLLRRIGRELQRARQGADWASVERAARLCLELDPLNETATLGLAEAMARSGSKHKAVQLLRDFSEDVGQAHGDLALPSRILTRRISEEAHPQTGVSVTALVGRTRELSELTELWSHARAGRCAVVGLLGEKSIGKTRVLEELRALIKLDGSGVPLTFRAGFGDRYRAMSLFSDMCAQLVQMPGAAGCAPEHLPYLNRLGNAAAHHSTVPAAHDIDDFVSEAATRRALLDLLESVASERALLIAIDDGDHLDSASKSLLETLSSADASLPILFVVACSRASALPHHCTKTIRLGPLCGEDAGALADQFCSSASYHLETDALQWCVTVADGNPGHLELLLRRASQFPESPSVPSGVLTLVDARLNELPMVCRHVLQACVAFGADCSAATIESLTGLGGYELISTLESLVEQGFVSDSVSGISCRGSLLAERVRETTTPIIRRLLHRRSAEFLEQSARQDMASQAIAWRISEHWQAAGDRARWLEWRRVCWQQLLNIGQPAAVVEELRQCLASVQTDMERATLLDELIRALQFASDVRGQLQALESRASLSDRIGDSAKARLHLAADLAEARYYSFEDTRPLIAELRRFLRSPELDQARRARAARMLVIAADNNLDAILAREAVEAVPADTPTVGAALVAQQTRLIYHAVFGDRELVLDLVDSIEALALGHELTPPGVSSLITAALARRLVDWRPTKLTTLETLNEKCLEALMSDTAIRLSARLGTIHFEEGNIEAAAAWFSRAERLVKATGLQRLPSDYLSLQIDLALAEDELSKAQELLHRLPGCFPAYATPRMAKEFLVYRTRVQQHLSARPIDDQQFSELMDWHNRAKCLGRHDDHMQVLWTELKRRRQEEVASTLLRDYVCNSRREARPCIHVLRVRTSDDPVWRELHNASRSRFAGALSTTDDEV